MRLYTMQGPYVLCAIYAPLKPQSPALLLRHNEQATNLWRGKQIYIQDSRITKCLSPSIASYKNGKIRDTLSHHYRQLGINPHLWFTLILALSLIGTSQCFPTRLTTSW